MNALGLMFLQNKTGYNNHTNRTRLVYILRTARGFWKYCKKRGRGGFLALKSHISFSSKKSCMETKVDIVLLYMVACRRETNENLMEML